MSAEEIKAIVEQQKKLYEEYKKEILAEIDAKAGVSPEQQEKIDKMELDFQKFEEKITAATKEMEKEKKAREDVEEKFKKLEAKMNRPAGGGSRLEKKDFICNELWRQASDPKAEEKAAATWKALQFPDKLTDEEKVLTLNDPETGGYLAPPEVVNEIIKEMREITPAMQIARVRTTGASQMVFPKKTGTITASRRGESESKSEATGLTYGTEAITLPEMYAYVDISEMDMEDSMFNLEAEVREEINDAFNAKVGTEFISGSGPIQLEGLLTNADIGEVKSGHASTLTYGGMIDLCEAGLKQQFKVGAQLMFNLNTLAKLRQVKDNTTYGDSIWVPGFGTAPNSICGKPYIISEDMPDVAADAYPIVYGNFKKGYVIGLRVRMAMRRLIDSALDKEGRVRISARMRVGGRVVLATAIKKHKIAA